MLRRRSFLAAAALPLASCKPDRPLVGGFIGLQPERGHLLRNPPNAGGEPVRRQCSVLVLGGGIAGLAAARTLDEAGIDDFAVLDLQDAAGGNSRGTAVEGLKCPLGAHYLPVPGDGAAEVRGFLQDLGIAKLQAGRWTYDERHLCHSPQERIFFQGEWQDGLLPVNGVTASTLEQYRAFARRVEGERRKARFTMPLRGAPAASHRELDAVTFSAWLDRAGLTDVHLRWYLDYCCRDDFGAGPDTVSAWAGIHYFASRHGFQPPGEAGERDSVLTWPEGNGFLVDRMLQPLGDRVQANRVVLRMVATRQGIETDVWDAANSRRERWESTRAIVALPLFVASRVMNAPPRALVEASLRLRYAPWVVANIHLQKPLRDRAGAPPSWDNVVYGARGLGYVDAGHQSLNPLPVPKVLTWYRALGDVPNARSLLLSQPWAAWRDEVLDELSVPHPDLRSLATRIEVARYGHAMAVPVPGTRASAALQALQRPQSGLWRRVQFAHADLSGYSVFEEAFTHGVRAAHAVQRATNTGR